MEGNEQLAVIIPMLEEVAGRIDDSQLGGPTPCSDFDVAGVLGHMTELASGFAPMFRGEEPSAAGPPDTTGRLADRFGVAMGALLAAVGSDGALERTITTPMGEMPGAVFARLVALDGMVHGWDLASSTGQAWDPPEAVVVEVDAFARDAISPEMREGGAFGAEQTAPEGSSAVLRLMAFTGRSV